MPAKKPIKTSAGGSAEAAKPTPKTNQPQVKKTATSSEGKEPAAPAKPKTRPTEVHEPVRERKLTPQQQMRLERSRRRKQNQLFGTLLIIAVVLGIVGVFAWQALEKAANTTASTSAAATSTAKVRATATFSALAPDVPPNVTGTPVTTADGLQYIDLKEGTGNTVKEGDTINVNYNGWIQSTEVRFDSSYIDNKGQPAQFTLSSDHVIKGWVEGIAGMKVGGKRRLIIPPALAYGDTANGPIPANSTLIFDVEVMNIQSSS